LHKNTFHLAGGPLRKAKSALINEATATVPGAAIFCTPYRPRPVIDQPAALA
jgi:hypothetical protein